MIHEALKKSVIARRYYEIKDPEKTYTNEQARKRFDQDNYIDATSLKKVIDVIHKEQLELIKRT